jgi:endo-1,4-beta-xylanase
MAPIPLWPASDPDTKTSPESVRISEQGEHIVSGVHRPSITPYLPDKASGGGVIVIPGGGHRELWMDHEGYRVGQWLEEHGLAAFVLKYRLAHEPGSTYTVEGEELADVQRAIRLVRSRAREWRIAPDRIGVIGFSAGGELAALAGTRYDAAVAKPKDAIDSESARPAFLGLIYPAIPSDMRLTRDTPPVFLLCGADDGPAIAEGVPALYLALKHAGISAELHILAGTGHGFGMRDSNPPAVRIWPLLFYNWLDARGMLANP